MSFTIGKLVIAMVDTVMLSWGDAALDLVKEIGEGTEKGAMGGNGCGHVRGKGSPMSKVNVLPVMIPED